MFNAGMSCSQLICQNECDSGMSQARQTENEMDNFTKQLSVRSKTIFWQKRSCTGLRLSFYSAWKWQCIVDHFVKFVRFVLAAWIIL